MDESRDSSKNSIPETESHQNLPGQTYNQTPGLNRMDLEQGKQMGGDANLRAAELSYDQKAGFNRMNPELMRQMESDGGGDDEAAMERDDEVAFGVTLQVSLERLRDAIMPQVGMQHVTLRMVWILAYLFLTAMFLWQFGLLVKNYLSYNTNVNVEIKAMQSLNFPAVTVCNSNPLRQSLLGRVREYDDLILLEAYAMSSVYASAEASYGDLGFANCSEGFDTCNITQVCIPTEWICNGINNCGDNSDELPPFNCTEIQAEREANITDAQGICFSPYIQCPNETFCAELCDDVKECSVSNGYDESTAAGCPAPSDCGGDITATAAIQQLAHADYPNNYKPNLNCTWTIRADDPANRVQITFTHLEIEGSSANCPDFIQLYDGNTTSASTIKVGGSNRVCGFLLPDQTVYTSTGNSITVRFKTDATINYAGFELEYEEVAPARARRATNNVQKRKQTTILKENERLRRSSNDVTGDYDYDYYRDPSDYASYMEDWSPSDQFYNIPSGDYFTMYQKSDLPDYSDFRLAATFPQEIMKSYGYQRDDFIVQCTFDGKKCDASFFKTFQDTYYGNCFSFNSIRDRNLSKPLFIRSSGKTGQEYGLKLTLFLNSFEFLGLLSPIIGARVLIHDAQIVPDVRAQSSAVAAGQNTFIAMRLHQINRLGGKYGNCTKNWPEFLQLSQGFEQEWPKYDRDTCLRYCVLNEMARLCNCTDSYEKNFSEDNAINEAALNFCEATNKDQSECRQDVYDRFKNNTLDCNNCVQGCESTTYSQKFSTAPWPSETYSPFLATKLFKSSSSSVLNFMQQVSGVSDATAATMTEDFRRNLARIEIFFESLNFEEMSEKAAYPWVQLLSDFGGNIGLWLGWSVLALFEVIQFFFECGEALALKYCVANKR